MATLPRVLKNFNLFVDGCGYAGKTNDIELPKLKIKTEEHRAGGMDVPVEMDMGMDKLECKYELAEYNEDVLKTFGLVQNAPVAVTLRGAIDDESGNSQAVVVKLQGRSSEMDMGSWKPGDKKAAVLKVTMPCTYYKLTLNGVDLIEIDILNMVRKINGVDQLETIRTNIGL